jgi:uncharacterized protein (DUF58 family)
MKWLSAWARRRQGDDALPVELQARRIYILPTRVGVAAGALLLMMLLTALNYGNSMAMFITFLLAGVAVMGIHECHRNLKGLRVTMAESTECQAGHPGLVRMHFENPHVFVRRALTLRCAEAPPNRFELAPRSTATRDVLLPPLPRGRHTLPRLHLETRAPMGLFRAWAWIHLPLEIIVYPQPAGELPLPSADGSRDRRRGSSAASGSEEWSALRPFVVGDSPRGVAWKLYARGAPLLVAQYEGEAGGRRHLDLVQCRHLPLEAGLSQIADWIRRCERRAEAYSLQLPGTSLPAGRGARQRRDALRALALYPHA